VGAHEPSAAGCSTAGRKAAHRKQVSSLLALWLHRRLQAVGPASRTAQQWGQAEHGAACVAASVMPWRWCWRTLYIFPSSCYLAAGVLLLYCSYMHPTYANIQLIAEGRRFLMLDKLKTLAVKCPVRIIHGVQVCAASLPNTQIHLYASWV
jgi:hypothetical protein